MSTTSPRNGNGRLSPPIHRKSKQSGRVKVGIAVLLAAAMALLASTAAVAIPNHSSSSAGNAFIDRAVRAMGGERTLLDATEFTIEANGSTWISFEEAHPTETNPTSTYERTYSFDVSQSLLRVDVTRQPRFEAFQFFPEESYTVVANETLGYLTAPALINPPGDLGSQSVSALRQQQRLFNPNTLLTEAVTNPGLVSDGGTVRLDGRPHRVAIIDDVVAPIQLFIDQRSGLITKVATMESHPLLRDIPIEVHYDSWQTDGVLAYPADVKLYANESLVWQENRTAFTVNPGFPSDHFDAISAADPGAFDPAAAEFGRDSSHLVTGFFALGFQFGHQMFGGAPIELATGVTLLPSAANSIMVELDDGVVVLEAPTSPTHGDELIQFVNDVAPGEAITHIIQSHHHIDHASGVRSFAAVGADVVVGPGVADLWYEIFDAASTIRPDAWSAGNATPNIVEVNEHASLILQDDDITITAYPVADPHADDMLLTTIEVDGQLFVFTADAYNAGFGITLSVAGPIVFFDALRDLGLIDQDCNAATPLTIVPTHGFPTTLDDALTELANLGLNVGC